MFGAVSVGMEEKWRIFGLLLWKNYVIRKRHWKVALFLQILLPMCIFLLLQKIRSAPWVRKENENVTYYPIETMTKEDLLEFEEVLLYYAPENNFTRKLMKQATECLSIHPASTYNAKENNAKEKFSWLKIIFTIL